jgi:hypothetical protein
VLQVLLRFHHRVGGHDLGDVYSQGLSIVELLHDKWAPIQCGEKNVLKDHRYDTSCSTVDSLR